MFFRILRHVMLKSKFFINIFPRTSQHGFQQVTTVLNNCITIGESGYQHINRQIIINKLK